MSQKLERDVSAQTVRRALLLFHGDELPRRRIDCLLLLAVGRSYNEVAETCGLAVSEVNELVHAVFSQGLAHAILFGTSATPATLSPTAPNEAG